MSDRHRAAAAVAGTPALRALSKALPAAGATQTVGGAIGSLPMAALAALALQHPNRLWVVAAASPSKADEHFGDLEVLLGPDAASHYPQREDMGGSDVDESHSALSGQRVEAFEGLLAGKARILVATRRALQEVGPFPDNLAALRYSVVAGQRLRRDVLIDELDARGFHRAPIVETTGCYAVRGGLVDLFSFGAAAPARVEFWGDDVESIRFFDILDQRSTDTTERIDILPVRFGGHGLATETSRCSVLDRLPRDTILVHGSNPSWDEDASSARRARRFPQLAFVEEAARTAEGATKLAFRARPPPPIERDTRTLSTFLADAAGHGAHTSILCDNEGQASRLEELIGDHRGALPRGCQVVVGSIAGGFLLDDADPPVYILTDHEVFRRSRKLRRSNRFRGAAALDSLAQLKPGDHVVHMEHGIGRFEKLERVVIGGESIEALVIVYDKDEVLRVPVYRLDQVERWLGAHPDDKPPRLHRIGGRRWKNLKRKTQEAINRTTAELLHLYAARRARKGHAFPADTRWQREMEASFLYEPTPDQHQAVVDVKRDMESPRIMDRLVCGDAGYGKTEVAVRAAFKAVQDGKQVAVLAPTTVLAAQHAKTFGDRLAEYPVDVRSLSRLDPPARQREVIAGLTRGTVDIVIGTHRILGKDVVFRDLGLVVIDEEQRLGVRQKERLKRLRTTVDVLTLTATPIPRTLYLALAGVRDLSQIRTPPRDRMPIVTRVISWSDHLIAEACQAELDRGGQVFFLHNRVQTIDTAAEQVRRLMGDASVDVAHGQLAAKQIDRIMTRFVAGDIDILVCSSIIENGLDVANANTMIVTRADRFGLSQLYQIRGRVGRWDRRAYCYLVVPERITPDAEKRLRVLEHYTQLGSGYQIAMRDLEVRGAGNLLGEDQSGFAHAVGIDTYMRLMEDAVRNMRDGAARERHPQPRVAMHGDAYLPDDYVMDQHQKLHLYRRLTKVETLKEVRALAEEIADRFGKLPDQAQRLLDKATLQIAGQRAGASRITMQETQARINFMRGVMPSMVALEKALQGEPVRLEVRRVAPLSLVLASSDGGRLTRLIVRALTTRST